MTRPGADGSAGSPPRSTLPAGRLMVGIAVLYASMWCLSTLDASSKWVLAAGVPVLVVAWFRYVVHLLLVTSLIVPLRGWRILRPKRVQDQALRGGFMLCATLMFFLTLRRLPQAEATAIIFLAPLIVLATAPWVLKEKPQLSRWIAAAVGFTGVMIVVRPGSGLDPLGVVLGLITAVFFAAQFIATRRVANEDPFTTLIWSGAVGALGLTAILPFVLPPAMPVLAHMGLWEWVVMLSTGVSGALGHLLQIQAYRNAPASVLAPLVYLQITCAATLGWLIWGQFPGPLTWLGIAITCGSGAGIALYEWRRSRLARASAAA